MSTTSTPRSGQQYRLRHGDYEAVIASIGATVRSLTHAGRDLVVPFAEDEVRPAYRGVTLAPWPNRVVDGRYTFAGVQEQLPLTEPARGHALHGLACWLDFRPETYVDASRDHVELFAVIEPQAGYPHRVRIEVAFRLDDDGLHTTVTATNVGDSAAPYGTGPHPYLAVGPDGLDAAMVHIPASTVVTTVGERLLPGPVKSLDEHPEFDFRAERVLGDVAIDHAFGGLSWDDEGLTAVTLQNPDGTGVVMEWDQACPWVQVHTADRGASDPAHRIGLAIEPMTCPPDAFNSGVDLVALEPGAQHQAWWRIAARNV